MAQNMGVYDFTNNMLDNYGDLSVGQNWIPLKLDA